jgi:hypothetical protein
MPGMQDASTPREKLVQELLVTGHIRSCDDFCTVATFLQCGRDRDVVLVMEELRRWPAAHAWLQDRLS